MVQGFADRKIADVGRGGREDSAQAERDYHGETSLVTDRTIVLSHAIIASASTDIQIPDTSTQKKQNRAVSST